MARQLQNKAALLYKAYTGWGRGCSSLATASASAHAGSAHGLGALRCWGPSVASEQPASLAGPLLEHGVGHRWHTTHAQLALQEGAAGRPEAALLGGAACVLPRALQQPGLRWLQQRALPTQQEQEQQGEQQQQHERKRKEEEQQGQQGARQQGGQQHQQQQQQQQQQHGEAGGPGGYDDEDEDDDNRGFPPIPPGGPVEDPGMFFVLGASVLSALLALLVGALGILGAYYVGAAITLAARERLGERGPQGAASSGAGGKQREADGIIESDQ